MESLGFGNCIRLFLSANVSFFGTWTLSEGSWHPFGRHAGLEGSTMSQLLLSRSGYLLCELHAVSIKDGDGIFGLTKNADSISYGFLGLLVSYDERHSEASSTQYLRFLVLKTSFDLILGRGILFWVLIS